jgi:flagellar biosynthesis protein FlhF
LRLNKAKKTKSNLPANFSRCPFVGNEHFCLPARKQKRAKSKQSDEMPSATFFSQTSGVGPMDVRKYEALTMQDAVKLIKKELGRDAVILATREKEKMLPGQNARTKVVEVVAAAASSTPSTSPSPVNNKNTNAQPVQFPRIEKEPDMKIVRGSPIMNALRPETRQKLAQSEKQATEAIQRRPAQPASQAATPIVSQTAAHPRSPTNDAALSNTNAQIKEIVELRQELERMRREMGSMPTLSVGTEVQEIKVLLHDLMKSKATPEDKKYPEYLTSIAIKLRAAGVLETLITEFFDAVCSMPLPKTPDGKEIAGEKAKEFYLNNLIRLIFKNISIAPAMTAQAGSPAIHCLVGPTGVGKTTTIAKLAAKLKIEQNKRIAFATMDTFRISAADQLRTYAKILDVPFQTISETSDLVPFAERHHDYDYIFIDTAGRVARDTPHIESLKSLKDVDIPIHFHLALSSTMKQRDIDETIRSFRFLAPESLIFTKLDESWNYGEILNTAVRGKIPLAFFATGQRVPEDLEVANKERIVERLFQL